MPVVESMQQLINVHVTFAQPPKKTQRKNVAEKTHGSQRTLERHVLNNDIINIIQESR